VDWCGEVWRAIPSTFNVETGTCKWYTVHERGEGFYVYSYREGPLEIMGARYRSLQILEGEDLGEGNSEVGKVTLPRPTDPSVPAPKSV
jgi:hypothetical protein